MLLYPAPRNHIAVVKNEIHKIFLQRIYILVRTPGKQIQSYVKDISAWTNHWMNKCRGCGLNCLRLCTAWERTVRGKVPDGNGGREFRILGDCVSDAGPPRDGQGQREGAQVHSARFLARARRANRQSPYRGVSSQTSVLGSLMLTLYMLCTKWRETNFSSFSKNFSSLSKNMSDYFQGQQLRNGLGIQILPSCLYPSLSLNRELNVTEKVTVFGINAVFLLMEMFSILWG